MAEQYFKADDAQSAKEAEFFCTIGKRRYNMFNAKNFEAKASISLADVKTLGNLITQKKPSGLEIKLSFTVYKCSEMFDNLITKYKTTGKLPRFECQVTQEDKSSKIGRSTKVYKDCIIDGYVLLSMFDADGDFIEQEIEAYAMDFETAEKYKTPKYMMAGKETDTED